MFAAFVGGASCSAPGAEAELVDADKIKIEPLRLLCTDRDGCGEEGKVV